ncbi:hypothetical protein BH10PSE12_BH10PSE12_34140 [soil metagenome]
MAVYIVATVRITDPEQFKLYSAAIAGMSERFGGESILKGVVSEILEGDDTPGERVVVTRFPNAMAARDYIGSEAYQAAQRTRADAATVTMRIVEA